MGQQFPEMSEKHQQFIEAQNLFFVGTATESGRVSVSPKGMDSLRIIDSKRVVWLNVTGSGNETSAHIQQNPRMTIMFCAFAGKPLILRLYGKARVIHPPEPQWQDLYPLFTPLPGARQIFDLQVELVQTSCGMAVPYFSFDGDRELLNEWAVKKGEDGIQRYWQEKNQASIDGLPTHIVERNRL